MKKFSQKKKEQEKWFFWGKWNPNLLTVSLWHEAMLAPVMKEMGVLLSENMKCVNGAYFFLRNDFDRLHKILEKENFTWFEKLLDICEKETLQIMGSKGRLEDFLQKLRRRYLPCIMLITFSDPWFEKRLEEMCQDRNISSEKIIHYLQPKRKTPLMVFQDEIVVLEKERIAEFVKKWGWVGTHAFGGKPLTKKDVFDFQIKSKSKQREAATQKTGEIPGEEVKKALKIARQLSFHRSNMVEVMNMKIFEFRQDLEDIAEKAGITYDDLLNHTFKEVLKIKKEPNKYKNKKRSEHFSFYAFNGRVKLLFGKNLPDDLALPKKTKRNAKIIRGKIASPGRAAGKVCIIKSASDCKKIQDGDILVASETTPDYIIAMKKAGAFVTNQGGITSHAAIVAREMKKPCVIGTKNATQLLKDGDEVEVDAEKGVVKIINKK